MCVVTLLSCASTNAGSSKGSDTTKNQNTETEANMETKKDFITNGYAGDCPSEYADFRLDGVEYGKIDHVIYHSNTCKMDRPFSILLPVSYDGVKKYPVVYFQHGIFGDENDYWVDCKATVSSSGITMGPWYAVILTGEYQGYYLNGLGGLTTLTKK